MKLAFWKPRTVTQRARQEIDEHTRALYDVEAALSKAEIDVAAHKKEIERLSRKATEWKMEMGDDGKE